MSLSPRDARDVMEHVRKMRSVHECSSFFEDAKQIQFFVRFRWWVPRSVQRQIKEDIHWMIVQRLRGPLVVKIY